MLKVQVDDNLVVTSELPDLLFKRMIQEERLFRDKEQKLERKKKKAQLKKMMQRVAKTRSKRARPQRKALTDPNSVRTTYEKIYESYCKLLGQPYIIDSVFCFNCSNYYWYGDHQSSPKRCQICHVSFGVVADEKKEVRGHLARPDFILDFNDNDARTRYRRDTQYHHLEKIKEYQSEYLKKVGIIRIDGGVHNKYHVQKRDYNQYIDFKDAGVKVFIVKNDLIDELLDRKDNGKSLLELAKNIGDAVLDEELYLRYTEDRDFKEYTKRPFKM